MRYFLYGLTSVIVFAWALEASIGVAIFAAIVLTGLYVVTR